MILEVFSNLDDSMILRAKEKHKKIQ